MAELKEPTSITDDPGHPASTREDPTGNPRKEQSPNAPLDEEERPTTDRPA